VLNEKDITMEKSNYLSLTKHNSEYVASTKSFGHYIWKKYEKMDVVPYIEIVDMKKEDIYEIVLMSDGVLDVLVNIDEIYPITKLKENNQSINIVNFSENRWNQNWNYKMHGYPDKPNQRLEADDITAMYCKI
jgi:serine/threonine protein phosphatase PrpC